MTIRGFDWDKGNWPKCAKHGVSKADIEHVLQNQPMVRPDRTGGGEPRFNAIGRGAGGRYLFIAFALRGAGDRVTIRPISARYLHLKEIIHYEQSQSA